MHTGLTIKQKYIKNVNISTCLNLHKRFNGLIKTCKSKKNMQYNDQKKRTKGHTIINTTLHRKLKIEQPESY